ncbi:Peptidylprolyl isomerase [Handroanthus impetiginosus]|uniref:Peptidylprolyl isomerase n=1 Tax=Handroanthus impetiginosus TaxID=429701 RepID=A0A2G9GJ37_9LAMI|nr:Peptidylprolyl isomerase [Handroanthus impetiginosus]
MARIKPQALLQQSKKKKGPSRISVATIAVYGMVVVVMGFFLFSSYRHWTRRSNLQTEDTISGVEHEDSFGNSKKVDIPKYAVINTSKGSITVELYKDGSPEVVEEFVKSCQKGRFKGMLFNRVIKNFEIEEVDTDEHYRPKTPIGITDMTLKQKI